MFYLPFYWESNFWLTQRCSGLKYQLTGSVGRNCIALALYRDKHAIRSETYVTANIFTAQVRLLSRLYGRVVANIPEWAASGKNFFGGGFYQPFAFSRLLRLSLRKSDLKSARSRLNFTQAQTALPETYDSVIQYVGSRKILPSHKRYTSRQITAPSQMVIFNFNMSKERF